jgi:hypothetical protein
MELKRLDEENIKSKQEEGEILLEHVILKDNKMQASIDAFYKHIKRVEVHAPSYLKHVNLMKNYLDRMDDKIMKGA